MYVPETAGVWALLYFGCEMDKVKRERVIEHIASILSEHQEVPEDTVGKFKERISKSFFAGDVFLSHCSLVHKELLVIFAHISVVLRTCSVARLIDVNDLEETLEIDEGGLVLLYKQSANQLPC